MSASLGRPILAYVQANQVWGSAEQYLCWLAEGVRVRSPHWDVAVLVPEESAERWRNEGGFYVQPFQRGLRGILRAIHAVHPDLVHVNDPSVLALAAARLARTPTVVVTWHSPAHFQRVKFNIRGRVLRAFGLSNPRVHPVVLSAANERILRSSKEIRDRAVTVTTIGLPDRHPPDDRDRQRGRAEFGLGDELAIISVGRLAEEKRGDVLLHGVAMARARGVRGIRVMIVGDGEQREELECLAAALGLQGIVQFLGWRSDIDSLLAAADLFALTSDYEGLPFALLEAMRSGIPVLATAVGGVTDAVDQGSGIVVPPGNPQDVAETIEWFVDHPAERRAMGERARLRFRREFRLERMIDETQALYERLLSAGPRRGLVGR